MTDAERFDDRIPEMDTTNADNASKSQADLISFMFSPSDRVKNRAMQPYMPGRVLMGWQFIISYGSPASTGKRIELSEF